MGLDMYLYKKHYVKQWEHKKPEEQYSVLVKKGGKKVDFIKPERISEVSEEVAYWRKANQIHNWFIENCGDGEQDKTTMYVSLENLKELLGTIEKVLESSKLVEGKIKNGQTFKDGEWVNNMVDGKYIEDPSVAQELLPTQSGFFFGSTEYDEYYYQDLIDTQKVLSELITECEENRDKGDWGEFEYYASW